MADDTPRTADEAFDLASGLQSGFEVFKRAWPVLFVGSCIKSCTEGGGGNYNPSGLSDLANSNNGGGLDQLDPTALGITAAVVAVVLVVVLVVVVLVLALRAWIVPGWLRTHEEVLRTGNTDWSTLFSGGDRFVPMLLWSLLQGVISLGAVGLPAAPGIGIAIWGFYNNQPMIGGGGTLLALLPAIPIGIYVNLGLRYGDYLVTFDERSAMEALGESWGLASGNRLRMILFGVVLWLMRITVALAGFCFFCVGGLVTGPIALALYDIPWTRSFLLLTRPRTETDAWTVREA